MFGGGEENLDIVALCCQSSQRANWPCLLGSRCGVSLMPKNETFKSKYAVFSGGSLLGIENLSFVKIDHLFHSDTKLAHHRPCHRFNTTLGTDSENRASRIGGEWRRVSG
jgi:hypothetical protein